MSDIIKQLAARLVWIAPVGVHRLRGFMVCKRTVNNPDGPNTRVDYLRVRPDVYWRWKKPFRENEHLFASYDEALQAAITVEKIPLPNYKYDGE